MLTGDIYSACSAYFHAEEGFQILQRLHFLYSTKHLLHLSKIQLNFLDLCPWLQWLVVKLWNIDSELADLFSECSKISFVFIKLVIVLPVFIISKKQVNVSKLQMFKITVTSSVKHACTSLFYFVYKFLSNYTS